MITLDAHHRLRRGSVWPVDAEVPVGMLTIHKVVASGAVGYAEYLSEVEARGDYYVGADGDPWASPGEWIGALAAELGLDGEVSRAALVAVMEGRDPRTGERVVRVGSTGDHVAAHDLVFSAPSSVTAAWVMADEEGRGAIQQAHDEAVRDAFAHIEKYFPLVRRRHGEQLAAGIAAFERAHGRPPTQSERWKLAPILNETAESLLSAHFAHHTAQPRSSPRPCQTARWPIGCCRFARAASRPRRGRGRIPSRSGGAPERIGFRDRAADRAERTVL